MASPSKISSTNVPHPAGMIATGIPTENPVTLEPRVLMKNPAELYTLKSKKSVQPMGYTYDGKKR